MIEQIDIAKNKLNKFYSILNNTFIMYKVEIFKLF